MSKIVKIDFLKRKRLTNLLGLSIDGSRLEGAVLRRTNGSVHLQQSFSVTLSLDPLTADPELVGREIRNHLDAAGVRERDCAVCVPLKWALTAQTELPDLPEADVASFLQLEAERGFHSDVEALNYVASRFVVEKKNFATLVGVPKNHVALLERVLRAAKLKPRSFSVGISALQRPASDTSNGALALAIGESGIGLEVAINGGIAALRPLEGTLESAGGNRVLHADVVARETRITLGQLAPELRDRIKRIRIFGPQDLAQKLVDELSSRFGPMGLGVEFVQKYAPREFGVQVPPDAAVSAAFSLAAEILAGHKPALEFLPPKVPAWQQVTSKYASGKARMAIAAAAAVLVIVGGAFAVQQWQIVRLQSRWNQMASRATDLQSIQDKIQKYRPWSDDSLRALTIFKQLTTAFPDDGAVSAKTFEIRDLDTVSCTGVARDNQSLLRMLEKLRATEGVSDVKVSQIRGRAPIQFTFDFRWSEGGVRAN